MFDGQAALANGKKGVGRPHFDIHAQLLMGRSCSGKAAYARSRDLLQKRGRHAFYYKNAVGTRDLLQKRGPLARA